MTRKILIFDRDGCVNRKAPKGGYVFRSDDLFFYRDAIEFFKLIHNRVKYGELKLAIATNQQGIAFELYSLDDVLRIHRIFLSTIGYSETLFPIYICPHAEGSCDCRKPRSGLLRQSIINSGFKKSEAIFFGDSLSDQLAAQDLNIPFVQIARSEDETFFADTVFFDFKEILEIID